MFDLKTLLSAAPAPVAQNLLGYKLSLWDEKNDCYVGGIICETEAYLAKDDAAAHSARGKTKANASIFKHAGTLYIYQMRQHFLIDIVTEKVDVPSSVLIRALQPIDGINIMKVRRGTSEIVKLCNGPSNLCKALGIDKRLDGMNVFNRDCPLIIEPCLEITEFMVTHSTRIGISKNPNAPLRYTIDI